MTDPHAGSDAHARLHAAATAIRARLRTRIVGLEPVVDLLLTSVFSGGHCLLVGVPGLAKTSLVRAIADSLSLTFRRVQFTPDLMPSDITGADVITEDAATGERRFRFLHGPVFSNILLADEINRTPPKTQAALLEAMEDGYVTVAGQRVELEQPFCVLATQNPIEQAGTYPLPAAQLDRFMFLVNLDYPTRDDESRIVRMTTAPHEPEEGPLVRRDELLAIRQSLQTEPAPKDVAQYATTLARRSRPSEPDAPPRVKSFVAWGVGPRAAQSLVTASKVRAALRDVASPTPDDVRALVLPTFRHRMVVNYQAQADLIDASVLVDDLIRTTPSPDGWQPAAPARPKRRLAFWSR